MTIKLVFRLTRHVTLINLPTRLHLQDSARGFVKNVVRFLCGVNMLPDRPLCSALNL